MAGFADNLKRLRKARGITQDKLGDDLIVNPKTIASYEEGRAEPKINRLIELGKYFNISIDELVKR